MESVWRRLLKLIPGLKANEVELRKNYEALKPQIESLRNASTSCLKSYSSTPKRAVFARDASFRQTINDLCRDLADEMERKPIPLIDDANIFGRLAVGIRKKKVYKQTADVAQSICDLRRVKMWFTASPPDPGADGDDAYRRPDDRGYF